MLLIGDRNIVGQAPGGALPGTIPGGGYGNVGAVALGNSFNTGTQTPAWTDKLHRSLGNVLLSDGSAQQLSGSGLRTLRGAPAAGTRRASAVSRPKPAPQCEMPGKSPARWQA
jgi:hypothetical protein